MTCRDRAVVLIPMSSLSCCDFLFDFDSICSSLVECLCSRSSSRSSVPHLHCKTDSTVNQHCGTGRKGHHCKTDPAVNQRSPGHGGIPPFTRLKTASLVFHVNCCVGTLTPVNHHVGNSDNSIIFNKWMKRNHKCISICSWTCIFQEDHCCGETLSD